MNREVAAAVTLRPLAPGDRPFVLDSFRRHLLSDIQVLNMVGPGGVGDHVLELDRLIRGPGVCAVACLTADPNAIIGWACSSGAALVFDYVRPSFRKWGIGAQMACTLLGVTDSPIPLVYWTRDAERIHRERDYPLTWAWQDFQRINRHHRMKGAA